MSCISRCFAAILAVTILTCVSSVGGVVPPSIEFVESLTLPSGVGRVLADPVRPKVYALTEGGDVLFIDRMTGQVEKTISTARKLTDLDISIDGQTLFVLDNVTREYWNQPPVTYVLKYDLATQTQNGFTTVNAPFYHMASGRDGRLLGVAVNQWVSAYQVNADTGELLSSRSGGYFGSGSTDWFNLTFVSNHDGTSLYRTEIGISSIEALAWDTSTDTMVSLGGRTVGSYATEPLFVNTSDTSLYVGDLRLNPDDLTQVLGVFPETIYVGTGDDKMAIGSSSFYDPTSGQLLGVVPAGTPYMTIGENDRSLYALDRDADQLHVMKLVPEPGSAMMLGLALAFLIGGGQRP